MPAIRQRPTRFSLGPGARAAVTRHLSPTKSSAMLSGRPVTLGPAARARLRRAGVRIPEERILQVVEKRDLRR